MAGSHQFSDAIKRALRHKALLCRNIALRFAAASCEIAAFLRSLISWAVAYLLGFHSMSQCCKPLEHYLKLKLILWRVYVLQKCTSLKQFGTWNQCCDVLLTFELYTFHVFLSATDKLTAFIMTSPCHPFLMPSYNHGKAAVKNQ